MAKTKKAKPKKAWAIKTAEGEFLSGYARWMYPTKADAEMWAEADQTVVRVLITEI